MVNNFGENTMKRRKQRKQVTMTVESSVEKKKLNEVLLSRKGVKN